jgi:hypothetical protein
MQTYKFFGWTLTSRLLVILSGVAFIAVSLGANAAAAGTSSLAPHDMSSVAQAPDCESSGVTCYYVCDCASGADSDCVAGNDAATGTVGAPWRNYEKARTTFGTLAPGDAIRFCTGGAWDVSAGDRWVNLNCTAADRCWVGDYTPPWASGNEGRPIIRRTDGADGFALEDGGNAEHEEGYVFENLDIRGSGSSAGFFLYNDIDDVEIRNVLIQGFSLGVHLAGSNACNSSDPRCDGQNDRITLRDSTIVNNVSQGWLGASNGTQLISNTFENNGSTAVFDHNIYISGASGGQTTGIRVIGNRLYHSTMVNDECTAVSLVVHGQHDQLLIEGNEVWEDVGHAGQGCWGIAVDNGYGEAEGFTNVIIRGNRVRNVGNLAIGVGACANCVIENNVIIHEQNFGITAIAAPDRSLGSGDLPQDNIIVRNNSIYIGPGSGGTAISVREMGDDHQIVGNAIAYTGASSSFNCLRADLGPTAYDAIDYNVCGFGAGEWADGSGGLSAWQALGWDTHSQAAAPGFADPAHGDLSAASASARIVDSGHPTLSSPIDIDGRLRDARPDVGAYEFIPTLRLYGMPADRAIHLNWTINTTLPTTSTWRIAYYSQTAPITINNIVSPTRAYTLTDLTNYAWYTLTLNAMLDITPLYTDTIKLMPTDRLVYLPMIAYR